MQCVKSSIKWRVIDGVLRDLYGGHVHITVSDGPEEIREALRLSVQPSV